MFANVRVLPNKSTSTPKNVKAAITNDDDRVTPSGAWHIGDGSGGPGVITNRSPLGVTWI
jgi:hypothetical protein